MPVAALKRPPLRPYVYIPLLAFLVIFTWATTSGPPSLENATISAEDSNDLFVQSYAEDTQEIRKKTLETFCRQKVQEVSLSGPNYVRRQVLRRTIRPRRSDKDDVKFVLTQRLIAYCHVPKAASTTWMLSMASINNVSLEVDLDPVLAIHDKMLKSFGVLDNQLPPSAFKFTFIRHPFERIVSCYHDKFVRRLEKSFLQPVIDWEAGLVGRLAVLVAEDSPTSNFLMTFEKFVKYVIYELENNMQTYGSLHWWPYTRLCGLCHVNYNFIGHTETLASDLHDLTSMPVLRPYKATIDGLFAYKFNKNDAKTEATSKAYFSQLSKQTTEKLYAVYEDDFKAGGYAYPEEYIRWAKDYLIVN